MGCAAGASWLAKQTGFQKIGHESFIGGLLHDVGKLFILKVLDDMKTSGGIDHLPSNKLMDGALQNLHTTEGDALLSDAARSMSERKIGCLPVVEDGKLVGILTEGDFVAFFAQAG